MLWQHSLAPVQSDSCFCPRLHWLIIIYFWMKWCIHIYLTIHNIFFLFHIYPYMYLTIYSFIYVFTSIYLCIYISLAIFQSIYLCIYISLVIFYLSIYASICLSSHWSIYVSIVTRLYMLSTSVFHSSSLSPSLFSSLRCETKDPTNSLFCILCCSTDDFWPFPFLFRSFTLDRITSPSSSLVRFRQSLGLKIFVTWHKSCLFPNTFPWWFIRYF